MEKKVKVCTIGGGTGTAVVSEALKGIKEVVHQAVVSVSDNGGSTGRLRDEFGFLPVGDLRQALAAMAADEENDWIRRLLLYRFEKGSGLEGHNLGNLILTALQDMSGSTQGALAIASKVFRLNGEVLPVTTDNTQIAITYQDGSKLVGEKYLDDNKDGKKVARIDLVPKATIYSRAAQVIEEAEVVIIGPGDLYASLLASLTVEGMKEVLLETRAKLVYVSGLMTKFSQTREMSMADQLQVVESVAGKKMDVVLVNNGHIPEDILEAYRANNDFPIVDDLGEDDRVVRVDLIKPVRVVQSHKDTVVRSYLRHDPDKLRDILRTICQR